MEGGGRKGVEGNVGAGVEGNDGGEGRERARKERRGEGLRSLMHAASIRKEQILPQHNPSSPPPSQTNITHSRKHSIIHGNECASNLSTPTPGRHGNHKLQYTTRRPPLLHLYQYFSPPLTPPPSSSSPAPLPPQLPPSPRHHHRQPWERQLPPSPRQAMRTRKLPFAGGPR